MAAGDDVMTARISNLLGRTFGSAMIGVVSMMAVPLPAIAQQADGVEMLLENRAVKAALESARAGETQTIADQIRLCEVPAPPFKEAGRAEELARVFKQVGLRNVRTDGAGNVLGDRQGTAPRPHLVIAAHLDTVFPEGRM